MAIDDPLKSRAAYEACAPDPMLDRAIIEAIETTRRYWRRAMAEERLAREYERATES